MTKQVIQINLTEFAKSARKHVGVDWPVMLVNSFGAIAEHAQDSTRAMTRSKFALHSDYITKGIRHFPATAGQKAKAIAALKKYGDMNAAVYVRPSNRPKNSLQFMADHETGEERQAKKKSIALPTKTMQAKGFRNSRGRVRFKYKPKQLLKRFKESGSYFDGNTTINASRQKRRRYPGAAFIIMGKSGRPFIARAVRRGKGANAKNLEFLYMFVPTVNINKGWDFAKNVWADVANSSYATISQYAKRMPSYGGTT